MPLSSRDSCSVIEIYQCPEDNDWLLQNGLIGYPEFVRTKQGNMVLPKTYIPLAEKIHNFEFRRDDILVMSNLRTGGTWLSEMLWAMIRLEDLDRAEEENPFDRVFYIDKDFMEPHFQSDQSLIRNKCKLKCPSREEDGIVLQFSEVYKGRRVFRTHLPLALLHPRALDTYKVLHVVRNPKDTCVSRYHLVKNLNHQQYSGSLSQFLQLVMSKRLICGDYWGYLRESWERRPHPNLRFVFYEDMKSDKMGELRKLNSFLQLDLGESDLSRVAEHAQFDRMQKRDERIPVLGMRMSFFRKGKIGSWNEELTPADNAKLENWIIENNQGLEIPFKYMST